MPDSVRGAPFLDEVVPAWMQIYLENHYERMFRSEHELEGVELVEPHWDARLKRCRRTYLRFVRASIKKGMIVFLLGGNAKERVGVFFVKKAGKTSIRIILGCEKIEPKVSPTSGRRLVFCRELGAD